MHNHAENMKHITKQTARNFCLYEKGSVTMQDMVYIDDAGIVRSCCFHETIEEQRLEHPNIELWFFTDVMQEIDKAQEATFKKSPVEITEDRFTEMLEVLPPHNWHRETGSESFKMSEMTCGNYTEIFCRIGEKFYELCDDVHKTHIEIVEMCKAI